VFVFSIKFILDNEIDRLSILQLSQVNLLSRWNRSKRNEKKWKKEDFFAYRTKNLNKTSILWKK